MVRIRQVIAERKKTYEEAVKLWRRQQKGLPMELSRKEQDFEWASEAVDRYNRSFRSTRSMLRAAKKMHPRI